MKVYYDADCDLNLITDKKIAVCVVIDLHVVPNL
jgi:ketol-acid reductoisomerase